MILIRTIEEMRSASRATNKLGQRLGLVPTMGALHEGHLSLVRSAKEQCDAVAVSIFVNPLQFGPGEDFAKYPRTFGRDSELLEKEGVDFLFAPNEKDMYPAGAVTYVTVEGLGEKLCGRSRPGHFRGVTTVVSKLFHIVQPDVAFFGQKDAAQAAIIRRMVRDLNFPVEIVIGTIVREPDGLAMSSRNAYLNLEQRRVAPVLHKALRKIQSLFDGGERDASMLTAFGQQEFTNEPCVRLDYLEIVDSDTLEPVRNVSDRSLVAVAAFFGQTRLIDNIVLEPKTARGSRPRLSGGAKAPQVVPRDSQSQHAVWFSPKAARTAELLSAGQPKAAVPTRSVVSAS